MDNFLNVFEKLTQPFSSWNDLLDILLVTLVLYNLLLLIRGTRAVRILLGILVLVALYYTARTLSLPALETTLENFFFILPVAIIVLFQHEIRRALANFGRTPLWGFNNQQKAALTFNEIVAAAHAMSERRIGALIVVERSEGLRNYIENGIMLDSIVSPDLLISLFVPEGPTHDGAVIIQGDRIAAATCFLPLTRRTQISNEYGTRHRAALGISEETDAVAVVVSEETGSVSVAQGGKLVRNLEHKDLRNLLYQSLISDSSSEEEASS